MGSKQVRPPAETLKEAIGQLREILPDGSEFEFTVEGEELHLKILRVSDQKQGYGTGFLAAVLAEADGAGARAILHADPTDELGDPSTYNLIKWYTRFGFSISDVSPDGWVEMTRLPQPGSFKGDILLAYQEAKKRDITDEEISDALDSLPNRHRL